MNVSFSAAYLHVLNAHLHAYCTYCRIVWPAYVAALAQRCKPIYIYIYIYIYIFRANVANVASFSLCCGKR